MTEQNEREAAAVRGQAIIDVLNTVPANTPDEERVRTLAANLGYEYGHRDGQTQWIAVSERLPDIGGEYIVAYDPEDGETPQIIETVAEYCFKSHGINEKYEAGKWYHIGSRALPFGDIIAWMPIPSYTESDKGGK